jgi:tRNA-Thr(GGU) m(6)t(6)A37 methyltransferase TsaA
MKIEYQPIGVIHSPFAGLDDMPIQPSAAIGTKGTVEVYPEYEAGLKDLNGFSHLILLYHFHRSTRFKLQVIPFMDTKKRGLFATRAPKRPNSIGLSVVKLIEIEGRILQIENVDTLNGTPLLDIKPYVPEFDEQKSVRIGWLENAIKTVSGRKSDKRFI